MLLSPHQGIPVSSMKFSSGQILGSLLWQDHFECCVPWASNALVRAGSASCLPPSSLGAQTFIPATHGNNNANSPGSRWGKTTQLLQNLCLKVARLKRQVHNLWWFLADSRNDFHWMGKKGHLFLHCCNTLIQYLSPQKVLFRNLWCVSILYYINIFGVILELEDRSINKNYNCFQRPKIKHSLSFWIKSNISDRPNWVFLKGNTEYFTINSKNFMLVNQHKILLHTQNKTFVPSYHSLLVRVLSSPFHKCLIERGINLLVAQQFGEQEKHWCRNNPAGRLSELIPPRDGRKMVNIQLKKKSIK